MDINMMDYSEVGIHPNDPRFTSETNSFTTKFENGMLKIQNWDEIKKIISFHFLILQS